ncbi:SIMPL domain-containing protein [Lacimonas salitolerans]|uniref:SIMPL domain-containing protein n=1 Tax=Lacimonas salitolerans TaxID=1323750 RepID=A0ABW4EAB9_9RHOB
MKRILICVLLSLSPMVAWADDDDRLLTVTGTGEVARAPDMAVIRVGVGAEDADAATALASTSEAMTRMQARLAEVGVERRDIQTSQLSLEPVYEQTANSAPRIVGFQATNAVTVRVREISATGEVLGALVGDGANRIDGVTFALQDPRGVMDEARRLAIEDARRKADLLAEAAGVTLGPVRDIREVGGDGPPRPMMMSRMASESMDVPMAEGEVGLSASVSVVYEIE